MVLVINKNGANPPVELPGGIRLWLRPVGQVDFDLAEGRVIEALARAADASDAAARYGFSAAKVQGFLAGGLRIGDAALAIELATELIARWEGLAVDLATKEEAEQGLEKLEPAPLSLEYIILLMNEWADDGRSYASIFLGELRKRRNLKRSEGNVSGAAPDGIGAAAPDTVRTVAS